MNTKPKQLPDGTPPQPATLLGELPNFDDLLKEAKVLRLYTGNLSIALRDLREYIAENFHVVYNRLDSVESDVKDILEATGLADEIDVSPDDTPQPNNNLPANPFE